MKNTFGQNVSVTLFGESHGDCIGAVLDGLSPGICIDREFIKSRLSMRRPVYGTGTTRIEPDGFDIVSGVFNGRTTGSPLCIVIRNTDRRSGDYEQIRYVARPGHGDYAAYRKYRGFEDYRGAGHLSGRLTAAVVAAGAVLLYALRERGIKIRTHILSCGGVSDRPYGNLEHDMEILEDMSFPVLDPQAAEIMARTITAASEEGDSVGGVLESAVTGIPAGVGEPWFDSVEGVLSHALFSIPAIKGVQFGAGFDMAGSRGSEFNDPFAVRNGEIVTLSNNNGGVNAGITNGMPIIFRCAVKPTPSIYKEQDTADFLQMENTKLRITGRHDPAVIHRAAVVVDSAAAMAMADLLSGRFGTDYLAGVQ